jgi:hypothetical protein
MDNAGRAPDIFVGDRFGSPGGHIDSLGRKAGPDGVRNRLAWLCAAGDRPVRKALFTCQAVELCGAMTLFPDPCSHTKTMVKGVACACVRPDCAPVMGTNASTIPQIRTLSGFEMIAVLM